MKLEPQSKGRDFELRLGRIIRQKGFKAARDARSGAGWTQKADIRIPDLPIHIEAKYQENINIKDWFRQAVSGSFVGNRTPIVVFKADHETLATLRFDDLLNLYREIEDLTAQAKAG